MPALVSAVMVLVLGLAWGSPALADANPVVRLATSMGRQEACRVLKKPGGVLILSVPYDNLLRRLIANPLLTYVNRRRRRAGLRLVFEEYRFTEREVRAFLGRAGFDVISSHPDDYDPPRTEGVWVDYHNLTFNPWTRPSARELFVLPGWKGRLAGALLRLAPWLASGEVAVVARPR